MISLNSEDFWDNDHGRDCLFGMPREVYHNKFFSHFQKRRFHRCLICRKNLDYDKSEMTKHFDTKHEGLSLECYYDNCVKRKQVILIKRYNIEIIVCQITQSISNIQ